MTDLQLLQHLLEEFINEDHPGPWFPLDLQPDEPDPFTELEMYEDHYVGLLLRLSGWTFEITEDQNLKLKHAYEPELIQPEVFEVDHSLDKLLFGHLQQCEVKGDYEGYYILSCYMIRKRKLDIIILLARKLAQLRQKKRNT